MRYRECSCWRVWWCLGCLPLRWPWLRRRAGEPITWVISVTVKRASSGARAGDREVRQAGVRQAGRERDDHVVGFRPPGDRAALRVGHVLGYGRHDWTAMGKVDKAFEDNYKSMKPEDAKER